MSNYSLKILVNFFVILLLQLLVFNFVSLWVYYIPFVYVLFLIILPFDTAKWLLIVSAFILGTVQDIFSGTIGIHSFATVFVAFLRPSVLSLYTPPSGYNKGEFLGITTFGLGWFLKYSFTIVLLHNFFIYLVDYFSFSAIPYVLYRTLINSIISEILLLAVLFGLIERFK